MVKKRGRTASYNTNHHGHHKWSFALHLHNQPNDSQPTRSRGFVPSKRERSGGLCVDSLQPVSMGKPGSDQRERERNRNSERQRKPGIPTYVHPHRSRKQFGGVPIGWIGPNVLVLDKPNRPRVPHCGRQRLGGRQHCHRLHMDSNEPLRLDFGSPKQRNRSWHRRGNRSALPAGNGTENVHADHCREGVLGISRDTDRTPMPPHVLLDQPHQRQLL